MTEMLEELKSSFFTETLLFRKQFNTLYYKALTVTYIRATALKQFRHGLECTKHTKNPWIYSEV